MDAAHNDECLCMKLRENLVLEMAWKWIASYIATVVLILIWNDALNMTTLINFTNNFKRLVDELSIYFEPCGFPIELVARFCMDKLQKIQ